VDDFIANYFVWYEVFHAVALDAFDVFDIFKAFVGHEFDIDALVVQ
jgi:hypothetical protein